MNRKKKAMLVGLAVVLAAGGVGLYLAVRPSGRGRADMTLDLGNGVTLKLVRIPAGKFMMGSPAGEPGRRADEDPQHAVTITKPFCMGIYTVTQAQYEQVMGKNPSTFKGADNPVETVSWDDAAEFCKKMSAKTGRKVRLPTEAEWEYACRAGTTTAFNTGATLNPGDADCNFSGAQPTPGLLEKIQDWVRSLLPTKKQPSQPGPKPVGSFRPNAFGLHDMHGNVWQWCADWYGEDYYANSPATDPAGPETSPDRVLRGGSWSGHPGFCRSAHRGRIDPVYRIWVVFIGFRVVVDSE